MNSLNRDQWKEVDERFDEQFKDGDDPFGLGITSIISKYGEPQKVKFKGKKEDYTMQGFNEAKVGEIKTFLHSELEKVRQEAYAQGVEDKEYVAEKDKKETIKKVRQETIEAIKDYLLSEGYLKSKEEIPTKKPEHGNCCTCQTCGYYHDECVCESNRLNKAISINKKEYGRNN